MRRSLSTPALITLRLITYALIAAALFFAFGHKASADIPAPRSSFPTPAAPAATVAIQGPHSGISADESRFEVAVSADFTGKVKVTLADACKVATSGVPGLRATIDGQTKDCSGGGNDIVFNNVTFPAAGAQKYNYKIKYRTLVVNKTGGEGHQPFNVFVSVQSGGTPDNGPSVSFDADNNAYNSSFAGNAFAMWSQDRVEFNFRTDCNYDGSPVYLKWQDADVGTTLQDAAAHTWLNVYDSNGNFIETKAITTDLGGNGAKRAFAVTLNKRYVYKWVWTGLSSVNALQVFIPFSENTYYMPLDCPNPPEGNLTLTCNPKAFSVTGIKDQDDGTAARAWRIVYGGHNHVGQITGGGATATGKEGTIHGGTGGNWNFTNNRLYYLQVKDDNGNWYNVDSARKTCPGSVGGGPADGICSGVTVAAQGTYDPPGGASVSYRTRVIVIVTDDFGRNLLGGNKTVGTSTSDPGVDFVGPKLLNYTAEKTPNIYISYEYQYYNTSTSPDKWVTYAGPSFESHVCYHATCSLSVVGDGPGGIVVAGGKVHVSATLQYPGNDGGSYPDLLSVMPPTTAAGTTFSVTINGVHHTLSDAIDKGDESDTGDSPFDVDAAASITNQTITATPEMVGSTAPLGPDCSTTFPVYAPFHITPTANIDSIDNENPTVIQWSTGGTLSYGEPIHATATSTLTKNVASNVIDGPYANEHDYGSPPDDHFTYNNTTVIAPGDSYCAHVSIYPGDGYQGPGGILAPGATATTADTLNCPKTVNEPYIHAFGSDIFAGGGFGEACTTAAGGINTYAKTTGVAPVGSGVQIGALSISPANGFGSAILRGTAPTGSTGLSFANTTNINAATPKAGSGGDLGGTHCVTDFFAKMPVSALNAPSTANNINLASNPSGALTQVAQYYQPSGGTLTINSGLVDDGLNLAIYVDGDVVINGNLTYRNGSSGAPWASLARIPSLYIVAKGNIYVSSTVNALDGMYVAQPNGANKGSIYTCASGTTGYTVDNADLLFNCKTQLVVNGAFVSKKIYFSRAFSSLRYSAPGERYTAGTPKDCGNGDASNVNDCAGEVFNFSPELYLSQPAIEPNSGPTTGKFDYITSLSPVL